MDILDDMDKGHLPTESHIDEKLEIWLIIWSCVKLLKTKSDLLSK
jgi:hypothetical protein